MKIIDYCIVKDDNVSRLERNVKIRMTQDWQPIGGVDSNVMSRQTEYLQTMVKYDIEK